MAILTTAIFFSVVAKSIIDAIKEPLMKKYPMLDMWWMVYVSWVVGALLSVAAGLDLFAGNFPAYPWAGVVLTAILVGGGSKLINDLFKKVDTSTVVTSSGRTSTTTVVSTDETEPVG